jgi:hypothetical protein
LFQNKKAVAAPNALCISGAPLKPDVFSAFDGGQFFRQIIPGPVSGIPSQEVSCHLPKSYHAEAIREAVVYFIQGRESRGG